jgi:hypothetical protein
VLHFSLPVFLCHQIEKIQRRAVKIIYPDLTYKERLNELNFRTLVDRRVSLCKRFYENNFDLSNKTSDLLPRRKSHSYNFRNARNIPLLRHVQVDFLIVFYQPVCGNWICLEPFEFNNLILEVTIARRVLPHPQGIKGSMHNLLNKRLFI